jgi:hypothetical protein
MYKFAHNRNILRVEGLLPGKDNSPNTSRNAAATLLANEVPAETSDKITMPLRARKIDVSLSGKKQRNVSDWAA